MNLKTAFTRAKVAKKSEDKKERGVVFEMNADDQTILKGYLTDYCADFGLDAAEVLKERFVKILPRSTRPYGAMYCPMPR